MKSRKNIAVSGETRNEVWFKKNLALAQRPARAGKVKSETNTARTKQPRHRSCPNQKSKEQKNTECKKAKVEKSNFGHNTGEARERREALGENTKRKREGPPV